MSVDHTDRALRAHADRTIAETRRLIAETRNSIRETRLTTARIRERLDRDILDGRFLRIWRPDFSKG